MGRLKKYQGSQILLQISDGFWKVGDYSIFSKVANLARLKKKTVWALVQFCEITDATTFYAVFTTKKEQEM